MKRILWIAVFLMILCALLAGCGGDQGGTPMLSPIFFENITVCSDIDTFIAEVDNPDGSHNNEAKDVGMILSPYFAARIGDTEFPCYACGQVSVYILFSCSMPHRVHFPQS